jgi:hypothetical protein
LVVVVVPAMVIADHSDTALGLAAQVVEVPAETLTDKTINSALELKAKGTRADGAIMAEPDQQVHVVLNQAQQFMAVVVAVVQVKKESHVGVGMQMLKAVTALQVLSKAPKFNILVVVVVVVATAEDLIQDQEEAPVV